MNSDALLKLICYFYTSMISQNNTSFFIASRLALSGGKSFTRVILGIAAAGLALSTAVMILSAAIITGFKNEIHGKIFGFWGHIHVYDAGVTRNFDLRPVTVTTDFLRKLSDVKSVEYTAPMKVLGFEFANHSSTYTTQGGVKSIHPYIIMPCLLENKKDLLAGLFKGIANDYDWENMKRFMVEGKGLLPGDTSASIVISKIISKKLQVKPGDKLIVSFVRDNSKVRRALKIAGIYNTGLEEYDKRFILGRASMLRSILGWQDDQYSGIEIFAENVSDIKVLNDFIYSEVLPRNLYAEPIFEKFPGIFEWLTFQDINESVILQLMALVAMINLTTVVLILILERTRMVGVLKALGANNWMIRKVFLFYAAYILVFGLLIGNLLGLGLAYIQKATGLITLDEASYYLSVAPIHVDFWQVLLINLGAFIVCMITLILPSFVVTRIRPVNALRFG